MKERILNIARHYNNIEHAERNFSCENSKNMRDTISHKQFLTVFTNLDFELPSDKPVALDIGCSSGRYVVGLKDKKFEAVGMDTAIIPLKYASERIDATFIRASVTDLPFKKETFDLVICIELLHHFSEEVLEGVLTQISKVTKADGIFVFDIKNKLNLPLRYRYKKRDTVEFPKTARTIHNMEKLVKEAGFEIIKKEGILFPITLFAPYVIFFGRKEGT
jgi:ubiquinone/menaquinone biosynthesis C-methylase UbiE